MPKTKLAASVDDSPRIRPAAPGATLSFNILTDQMAEQVADHLFPRLLEALRESMGKSNQDELLTPDDVATLFKVTRETVFQWRKKGHLKAQRVAGRVYFRKADLDEVQGKVSKYHVAKFPNP